MEAPAPTPNFLVSEGYPPPLLNDYYSPPPGGIYVKTQYYVDCTNSSNPLCFSTAISGSNLITNLWFSLILGSLSYLGFVIFRGRFRFYQARLDMPQVTHKPPPLKLRGFYRVWSWLIPVFKISDEELLLSAGMDALVAIRILSFGILLLLPITLAAMAILIPINYLDNYYTKGVSSFTAGGYKDDYTTVFIRLTMSNLTPGTPLMWVHFIFVYATVFWACWLITEHYKEYITLRQSYVIRSTALPDGALGGSMGALNESTPLIASRSPRKRKHALASDAQITMTQKIAKHPENRQFKKDPDSGSCGAQISAAGGGGDACESKGEHPKIAGHHRTHGAVKLPRRDASGGAAMTIAPDSTDVHNNVNSTPNPRGDPQQQPRPYRLGQAAMTATVTDWTTHDFSKDVLDVTQQQDDNDTTHPSTKNRNSSHVVPKTASTAVNFGDFPRSGTTTTGSRPSAFGTTGGNTPLIRQPSNAAVAAALETNYGNSSSAAEALAKIRHHRALSGAGVAPKAQDDANYKDIGHGDDEDVANGTAAVQVLHLNNNIDKDDNNNGSSTNWPSKIKARPPQGLSAIIQSVIESQDNIQYESSGELATVTALAPDFASPYGMEGVAQRWWSALSSLGNKMFVERRRSLRTSIQSPSISLERSSRFMNSAQSITFKGAVPIVSSSSSLSRISSGPVIAANASLYTVLVTDQPVERLRLKRPLGSMEFWHQKNEENLLNLQTSAVDELDPEEGVSVTPHPEVQDTETVHGNNPLLHDDRYIMSQRRGRRQPLPGTEPVIEDLGNASLASSSHDVIPQHPTPDVEGGHARDLTIPRLTSMKTTATPSERRHEREASLIQDPGELERGMGLSAGWSATWNGLRQWWRHRGRYREWRRDVRWAMFNKRVRTATEMFTELFGDDFDAIIPIYPTKSVEKYIQEWDATAAALERAQYHLKELALRRRDAENWSRQHEGDSNISKSMNFCCRPRIPLDRNVKRLKAKIAALAAKTTVLQDKISTERDAVLSDLPSTCFFATFKSQEAAAIAAQANLNPVTQRLFDVQAAPSPDDVNWPALERSWWQRQARPVFVIPLILFIMLLPIGAFTGAFAQLTIAFCGNPQNPGPAAENWFCSHNLWATFFRNILTSIAPSLLLSLYHLVVLPVLVYYTAQAEGRCFSLSQLDRRCADLFFYWDVFNVFLGAMLGGSVLAELPEYLNNPQSIWITLSSAIPASSNFFINYVSYRALVMAWFRLFYPHQAILTCILKWLRIISWAKTPRDKALEAPVRNCRYGRDVGIPVLMNFVMVLAYAIVSPLILPFGLLYFMLLWAVWRYQMLYVYQRQYESGGQFWPLVAHKTVGCLLLLVIFTSVVLIFKKGYAQAALILATLPLYLLRFDMYLTNRYDAVVAQVPLMAVHKAGKVAGVDPDLWTPPPLRQGAKGWNPEWGKVWQWWGIPRYTL